jgi:hypothetical protein
MNTWKDNLRFDPLPALLSTHNIAIQYFVRRDLLKENVQSVDFLWKLPEVEKLLKKQQSNFD